MEASAGIYQVVYEDATNNERLWEEWMERSDVKAWRLACPELLHD